jgi:hypothetical protein
VKFHVHRDAVLMSGIVDMEVGAHGGPKQMTHLLFVLAWARQGGAWLLEYRQATRIHAA